MLELKSGVELNDRYVVDGVVGTGGYATVWRASDKQLNRSVALKRLLKYGAAAADVSALVAEAQKNAQLVHSNIVQVYDIIDVSGEHLIVMEYVDGQSLESLVRNSALTGEVLPLETAIAILRDALAGIDYAHSRRICHRDLSPANILLTASGVPKIGDFGIAKVVAGTGDAANLKVTDQAGTGNASYMSPEQARGEPADFASDLFMLGIVGYLLLTGKHPFAHPSGLFSIPELLLKDDFAPEMPRPASNLAINQQRLFREYAAVVMRLLQREKAGRFGGAREAIDAIDAVSPTLDCPSCGERVPDHHSFCGFCGAGLIRSDAAGSIEPPSESPGVQSPDDADELVERGYQLSLLRRWDAAMRCYSRAIEIEPGHKKAVRNLAFALNRVGRHEHALTVLDGSLRLGGLLPEHRASMLYERALAQQSLRRYDQALMTLAEALDIQPGSTRLRYMKASTLDIIGRHEEARREAREVLKRVPDHAGALRLLN